MVSKLAKQTIEQWKKEGLDPSVEDVVHLNALGLKVERGSDMYDFSALPRVAFIGDICIYEPTVAKKIWMDKAYQLIDDNLASQIFFTVFALYCDGADLPKLNDVKALTKTVTDFAEEHLMQTTETQMFTAIDYVLNGNDPTEDEDFEANEEKKRAYVVPDTVRSVAMHLALNAMACGIDEGAMELCTLPAIERMITVAAMQKGADLMKNERAQNAAKFMVESKRMHARLAEQKNTTEDTKE